MLKEIEHRKEEWIPKYVDVAWLMLVKYKERDGLSFLMAERVDGSGLTFPGGKIYPHQNSLECAVNELKEETGIEIREYQIRRASDPLVFAKDNKVHRAYPFVAIYDDLRLDIDFPLAAKEPDKHRSWRWYSGREVMQAIVDGKLPLVVLKDTSWLDLVFYGLHGDEFYNSEVPAWYLDECEIIRMRTRLYEFHKKVFRCDVSYNEKVKN